MKNKKKEIIKTKQVILNCSKQIAQKYNLFFERKMELIASKKDFINDEQLKKYELTYDEKKLLINFFSIVKSNDSESLQWVKEIQEKYFLEFQFKDNLGNLVSLETFLDEFVKTNMINNKIINYNNEEIAIQEVISYLYDLYEKITLFKMKKMQRNSMILGYKTKCV